MDNQLNLTPQEAMSKAQSIVFAATKGTLDYKVAEKEAQPYLEIVNKRGREIAKKYGKRHTPITFKYLAR